MTGPGQNIREQLSLLLDEIEKLPDIDYSPTKVQMLSGFAKLNSWVRQFYDLMSKDILIGFFFDGRDLDHIAVRQTMFLWKAAGRNITPEITDQFSAAITPVKGPVLAHEELPPILWGHFDRRIRLLEAFLKSKNLSEKSQKTWIDFEFSFRKQILKASKE